MDEEMFTAMLTEAVAWIEVEQRLILVAGRTLTAEETDLARDVDVEHPELIRILMVDEMPLPDSPLLKKIAVERQVITSRTEAFTMGYGIFIKRDSENKRWLLAHEFRHVHQREQAGSLRAMIAQCLREIFEHGYKDAPFERDAHKTGQRYAGQ